jgi:3-hydroxyacyl-[acyl-carrier-protein] dehydratase
VSPLLSVTSEIQSLSIGLGLVDRILALKGLKITAQKNLSITEDFLLDHFPEFPVMPGVLMIQAALEAAGWWLKSKLEFKVSGITLRELRNVRFSSFLRPGATLILEVENLSLRDGEAEFQGKGSSEETVVLSLKFKINYAQLEDILGKKEALLWTGNERANFNKLFSS